MQKNTLVILAVAIAMALTPAVHAAGPKETPPAAAVAHAPASEAARAAHEFYRRLLKGPTGKPGVWVGVEDGQITRYSKSGSTYINHTLSVSADGTLSPASVTDESVDDATGAVTVTNEGRRFRVEYAREPNDTFRLTIVREPRKEGDRTLVQVVRFAGDGMETTLNARTSHDVWRSEAAALEHQTAVAKLRASQAEVKRTQERLAALKAEARQREMEDEIRRREAEEAEQQSQVAQRESEDEAAHAQWEAESRRSSQQLEDSLQRLRDSTAEYEAVVKRLSTPPAEPTQGKRQSNARSTAGTTPPSQVATSSAPRAAPAAQQAHRPTVVDAGVASNSDDDANQCVSGATLKYDDTTKGNTAAYVTNGCGRPVDVRICLMTESKGWQCQTTYGVATQTSWSASAFHATGNVFQDARISGSKRALRHP